MSDELERSAVVRQLWLLCSVQEFMVQLTIQQSRIGQILQIGSQLLSDSSLLEDEVREVEAQMALLNSQWEDLRVRAMDRQTRLAIIDRRLTVIDFYCLLSFATAEIVQSAAFRLKSHPSARRMRNVAQLLLWGCEEKLSGHPGSTSCLRTVIE